MRRRLLAKVCLGLVSALILAAANDDAAWRQYTEQFRLFREKHDFPAAEKAARAAIQEAEKSGREADLASSWNNLAALYYDAGRYPEAEKFYQQALALSGKLPTTGERHDQKVRNNLALLYIRTGRLADAESLLKQAIQIGEASGDPLDIAGTLNNLTELYRIQGRFVEAEKANRRSVAIWEEKLGPEDPKTAIGWNNLGALLTTLGRYADAEPLLRRALAIDEKVLGPEHPITGSALTNVAELSFRQGRYDEAETLGRRALAIKEKAF